MKQIQFSRFGDPGDLKMTDLPTLTIQQHQLKLNVLAAGVNPIDAKTRRGLGFVAEQLKDQLPWTPGYEMCGEVIEVGSGVKGFAVGDRVAGMINFPLAGGCYAQQVVADPSQLIKLQPAVDPFQAAALPLAGMTAWQALYLAGELTANKKVLIIAAAGGVGHLAVQLAVAEGAQVTAVASGKNRSFLQQLGVQRVVDYTCEALPDSAEFDLIIDGLGGQSGIQALDWLKQDGILVTLPTITAEQIIDTATEQGKLARGIKVGSNLEQLGELFSMLARGNIQVHLQSIFPLGEAAGAHQDIERGHVRGKLVLDCQKLF